MGNTTAYVVSVAQLVTVPLPYLHPPHPFKILTANSITRTTTNELF